ncbi:hypothetical protein ILYODFUR_022033 [Ilyodon furcidens]|uniref:Uncharacterized protein n=1 Tax=Ilyodon furcidens TaxID=33524 RepID=A0ABV0TWP2_9TELE
MTAHVDHRGAGAYLQKSTDKRWGIPWTGHQSIAGQHRDTQDKQPFRETNLPNSHVCGHACTGRTWKLHAERPPAWSRTFLLQGNSTTNCATVQPP